MPACSLTLSVTPVFLFNFGAFSALIQLQARARLTNACATAILQTALISAAKADGEASSVALAEQMFLRVAPHQRNGRMYTAMIGAFSRVGRVCVVCSQLRLS